MKILYVIPSYEPAWSGGGTVAATSQLCRALARKGAEVTVYTTDINGRGDYLDVTLNKQIDLGQVKVWYFHCNMWPRSGFYSRDLAKKLNETVKYFDIVNVSATWQHIQKDVYSACKRWNKPYVISPHGSFSSWGLRQSFLKKKIYWYLIGRQAVKNATAIHFTCIDERIKAFKVMPFLEKMKNFVVPNGINLNDIGKPSEDIRKKLNIGADQFVLLSLGRVHRKKGIHFILEALKKIKEKKFTFLIVGPISDKKYFRQLKKASSSIKKNIVWVKQVDRDEVWNYYYASNLFVLPSYDENFGMVLLEAMSCGLPVLISKNVGIWREIQDAQAGLIIEQDASVIAQALAAIFKEPVNFAKISHNTAGLISDKYNIEVVASEMLKAYEGVLTGF